MHLLILGGGVFLGATVLDAALCAGHRVTVFNRGLARSRWPEDVEAVLGDRRAGHGALAERRFDAVVDTSGYVPADVAASTAALGESGAYVFVSSVSAYAMAPAPALPIVERHALESAAGLAPDDRDPQHYGAQKAACEATVQRVFGERALVVRPGLIVGPGDPTGRFDYWPWRTAAGGAMLVPDARGDPPLQWIDVRDLAAWMVGLVERGARGAYNATGPSGGGRCGWGDLLAACRRAAADRGHVPAEPVRVPEAFLREHGVRCWSELPLWVPADEPGAAAVACVGTQRAEAAGLVTRPLAQTLADVLDAGVPPATDPRRAGKLTPEREAGLLALWAARRA